MKFLAIALFVCVVTAAPVEHDNAHAEIVRSEMVVNPESYEYHYETSNGIAAKSAGQLKQVGEEAGVVSQGDYSFTAEDGVKYAVSYVADENGYQPTGDHLPVAPPIPEAIQRSLEWIAAHPQAEEVHSHHKH